MNQPSAETSRRSFLKTTLAASALAGVKIPAVHAAGSETIRAALIGCGGRGTGAASNAMSVSGPPVELVSMADVFESKINGSFNSLKSKHAAQFKATEDTKFVGFDAYKKAIDVLKPGDIAMFATPLAFRPMMFKYCIDKGLHVFMEKPLIADAPSARLMFQYNEEAKKKNLKCAVGLMCRHGRERQELFKRIKDGEIGEIILARAYRMQGPIASFRCKRKPEGTPEVAHQIKNFHSFLWASGGAFSDFFIHNIDEACWMKDQWPVKAQASGGRHYREVEGSPGEYYVDQNFDHYSVEYTFPDGTKFYFEGRNMNGCEDRFATYVHGTKGLGVVSTAGHSPAKSKTFKGHEEKSENLIWKAEQPESNPYQNEWDDLIDAIRNDKPYNEIDRGIMASAVTSMGRFAAHTGQAVTYDEWLANDQVFAPDLEKMTMDGPAPVMSDAKGFYPVPKPGELKKREYQA
jgi:predicted dehydrogenase